MFHTPTRSGRSHDTPVQNSKNIPHPFNPTLLTDIIPPARTPAPPPSPSSTTLLVLLAALPRSIPPPIAPDAAAAAAMARFAAVDASKFCIKVLGTPAEGAALTLPPPPVPPTPPAALTPSLSPAAGPSAPSPDADASLAVALAVAGSDKDDGAAKLSAAPVAASRESPLPTWPLLSPPPPVLPGAPPRAVVGAGLLFFELECGCARGEQGGGGG